MLESILNELTVNTVYVHEYMTNHFYLCGYRNY